MIDKDKGAVQAKVAKAMKDVPEERVREFLTYGTPEEVNREVESFRDAGIEYFIVSFEPRYELEALELFGREIVQKY